MLSWVFSVCSEGIIILWAVAFYVQGNSMLEWENKNTGFLKKQRHFNQSDESLLEKSFSDKQIIFFPVGK